MKKYIIGVSLLLLFAACSKKDNKNTDTDNTVVDSQQTVSIQRAIFMDPESVKTRTSDPIIMDNLIVYLNKTPKGAVVHISIYLFNYERLVEAVERAYDRGVEIHLLIDSSRATSIEDNKNTIPKFQNLFESPSEVVVVKNDITSTAIDHEKVVLFSEIKLSDGIAKNVIFSTSHNFTESSTKKVQDAVVLTNEDLYNYFVLNWRAIKSHASSGMKNFTYTINEVGDSITAYFFPRRIQRNWDGGDTYLEILDKISDYSSAKVRVIMSDWSRVEVAQKLTELQQKGGQVEVITKDKSGNTNALNELQNMVAAGGVLHIVPMKKENTHSKITMIKGTWDGKEQEILCTGSHNYTYNALKNNNEVLLLFRDSKLFKDYWNYFDDLKSTLIFK